MEPAWWSEDAAANAQSNCPALQDLGEILTQDPIRRERLPELLRVLGAEDVNEELKMLIFDYLREQCSTQPDLIPLTYCIGIDNLLVLLLIRYSSAISIEEGQSFTPDGEEVPQWWLIKTFLEFYAEVISKTEPQHFPAFSVSFLMNVSDVVTITISNVEHFVRHIFEKFGGRCVKCKLLMLKNEGCHLLCEKLTGMSQEPTLFFPAAYVISQLECSEKEPSTSAEQEQVNSKSITDQNVYTNASVTLIRVVPPKFALFYISPDWSTHLQQMSDTIGLIREYGGYHYPDDFFTDQVVGFPAKECEMQDRALTNVPYLRGRIFSHKFGNVMLWGLDVGTWVFVEGRHLVHLSGADVEWMSPLVSIGTLEAPVHGLDVTLLENCMKILTGAAEQRKRMNISFLFPRKSVEIMTLLQFAVGFIRVRTLFFLQMLTQDGEYCEFIALNGIDGYLIGMLECYVHFLPTPGMKSTEIIMICNILKNVFKKNRRCEDWDTYRRVKRVLDMMFCEDDRWMILAQEISEALEDCQAREDEKPLVEAEKPLVEDKKPFVEAEKPLVEDEKPLVENDKTLVDDEKPLVEGEKPLVEEKKPLVEEKNPVVEEKKPLVEDKNPVVEDKNPVVEERKLLGKEDTQKEGAKDLQGAASEVQKGVRKRTQTHAPERTSLRDEGAALLGCKLHPKCDNIHVCQDFNLWKIAEAICQMLERNRDGCIYFGVTHGLKIVGKKMREDEKICFKQDIAKIMIDVILPSVPTSKYAIEFIPLYRIDEKKRETLIESLYLICIHVSSSQGRTHYLSPEQFDFLKNIYWPRVKDPEPEPEPELD